MNDRNDVSERRANRFSKPEQPSPFSARQRDSLGQPGSQDPILDREVVDLIDEVLMG